MHVQLISVTSLKPGTEYPGGSINSRKYSKGEIDEMKESIMVRGILQSLLVVPPPEKPNGTYFVAAGNRRLEALAELLKEKKIKHDYMVPIVVRPDLTAAEALDASLEENVQHAPLHPVEEYECYAALKDRGMTAGEIGKRFGLKEKDVQGALALGQLSPAVRGAWLKGEIKVESAMAFTLGADHTHMDAVFKRLKKGGAWKLGQPQTIRAELGGGQDVKSALKFVTREAYEKAGGKVRPDLFGDEPAVSDQALLAKLTNEKLDGKVAELLAEGWGWAEVAGDLNRNAEWSWDRVPGGEKATKEHKAKAGCIVTQADGEFKVLYGRVRPGSRAPGSAARKAAAAKAKNPEAVSNAIAQRMSEWANIAIGDAIAKADPYMAIAAALAAVASDARDPLALQEKSWQHEGTGKAPTFHDAFLMFRKLDRPELLARFARMVGNAVNIRTFDWRERHLIEDKDIAVLCDAMSAPNINTELEKQFKKNAGDYFESVSKDHCLGALDEALGKGVTHNGKSKSEIAAVAIKNVPSAGWLPPEMRTSHYAGPEKKKAAGKKKRR